jgi:hypothetical protein
MSYEILRPIRMARPVIVYYRKIVNYYTESLVSQIVTALRKIKDVFTVLTSRFTDRQIEFPAMSKIIETRAKKEFDETKFNLSIRNNGRLKRLPSWK